MRETLPQLSVDKPDLVGQYHDQVNKPGAAVSLPKITDTYRGINRSADRHPKGFVPIPTDIVLAHRPNLEDPAEPGTLQALSERIPIMGRVATTQVHVVHTPEGKGIKSTLVHSANMRLTQGKYFLNAAESMYTKQGKSNEFLYHDAGGIYGAYRRDRVTHQWGLIDVISDNHPLCETAVVYAVDPDTEEMDIRFGIPHSWIEAHKTEVLQHGAMFKPARKLLSNRNDLDFNHKTGEIDPDKIGDIDFDLLAKARVLRERRDNGEILSMEDETLVDEVIPGGNNENPEISNAFLRMYDLLDQMYEANGDIKILKKHAKDPDTKLLLAHGYAVAKVMQRLLNGDGDPWNLWAVMGALDMSDTSHVLRNQFIEAQKITDLNGKKATNLHGTFYVQPITRPVRTVYNSPSGPQKGDESGRAYVPAGWQLQEEPFTNYTEEVVPDVAGRDFIRRRMSKQPGWVADISFPNPTLGSTEIIKIMDFRRTNAVYAEWLLNNWSQFGGAYDSEYPDNYPITLYDTAIRNFPVLKDSPTSHMSLSSQCYGVMYPDESKGGEIVVHAVHTPGESGALYQDIPSPNRKVSLEWHKGHVELKGKRGRSTARFISKVAMGKIIIPTDRYEPIYPKIPGKQIVYAMFVGFDGRVYHTQHNPRDAENHPLPTPIVITPMPDVAKIKAARLR